MSHKMLKSATILDIEGVRPRMSSEPLVSVVIPTYKRLQLVRQAVESVLTQSYRNLELLVVNDGPDAAKRQELSSIADSRLCFFEAPRSGHASAVRNFGISKARGEWIALLDDDDRWLPDKLAVQMRAAHALKDGDHVFGGVTRVIWPDGRSTYSPRKVPAEPQQIDDFLFSGTLIGRGGVDTSTLLAPSRLFKAYPFRGDLQRHEDWQWLLDVAAGARARIIIVPEIVCERQMTPRDGLSRPGDYDYSRAWYDMNSYRLSLNSRHSFVSRVLARKAAHDRKLSAMPWLLHETLRTGGGNPLAFVRLLAPWVLPRKVIECARRHL